jgi:CRISPR/Cas system-associated protein Cas7 (RAMP superfamily)
MSEHEQNEIAQKHKKYHFFVDAKRYESEKSSLTGADIKAIAVVTAAYQLFLEEEGDTPDKPIADSETVVLKEGEDTRHFYAVPPATFGVK